MKEHLRAVQAIINIHEAASLLAIAPNFDLMFSRKNRHCDFARYRCRRLFAATIPGSVRSIDVVITRNASFEAHVFAEVSAQALAKELFPAIAILRISRISV